MRREEATLTVFELLTTTGPCHGNRDFVFCGDILLDLVETGVDIDGQVLLVVLGGWLFVASESNLGPSKRISGWTGSLEN